MARVIAGACLLLALALASADDALACACCSDRGSRTDATVRLDEPTRVQLERMVFANEAAMATDESDGDRSILPPGSSSSYELKVTRDKGVLTFAFKDPVARTGRMIFRMPGMIHVFAVDPFGDAKDEGLGPSLYKEWRLTAPVSGDGIFRRGTRRARVTLIFHGSGRGCTEADHFTDWSLILKGPAGNATFYGRLATPQ